MPFVNDLIEHNRGQLAREGQGPLPSRFLFEPAAVMACCERASWARPECSMRWKPCSRWSRPTSAIRKRPLGVQSVPWTTGVGKTEIVRLLAQAIHGRADALCRIDMNTLAQEHYAAALAGAPPGYVGSRKAPRCSMPRLSPASYGRPGIVLFDELEKADRQVIRTLLNVLDSGQLVLSAGSKRLDFRNSLIFMTSKPGRPRRPAAACPLRARLASLAQAVGGSRRDPGRGAAWALRSGISQSYRADPGLRAHRPGLATRAARHRAGQAQSASGPPGKKPGVARQRQGLPDAWSRCPLRRARSGPRLRRLLEPAVADCLLAQPLAVRLLAIQEGERLVVREVDAG